MKLDAKFKVLAKIVPYQCFILALLYIDRVSAANEYFMLHSGNCER